LDKSTTPTAEILELRRDLDTLLRRRVLAVIHVVLEEELSIALGCGRHERTSVRSGYRNGHETREITTQNGTLKVAVPRGRIFE